MKHEQPKASQLYTEPEAGRRKLAAALRKRSMSKRYTEAERAEFARMADAWAATLPNGK